MKNKIWKKPTVIVMDIGKCRYCSAEMNNQESFVVFLDKTKAHYQCMKNDDEQRALDKTYE